MQMNKTKCYCSVIGNNAGVDYYLMKRHHNSPIIAK